MTITVSKGKQRRKLETIDNCVAFRLDDVEVNREKTTRSQAVARIACRTASQQTIE